MKVKDIEIRLEELNRRFYFQFQSYQEMIT